MILRYDFSEKMDLQYFKKQYPMIIKGDKFPIEYFFYFPFLSMQVEVVKDASETEKLRMVMSIYEISKNRGRILLNIMKDERFKDIKALKDIFYNDSLLANVSIVDTGDALFSKLCDILKVVFRVNNAISLV